MERRASDLLGKPVITFDTGRRLAHVEDLLVNPDIPQVLALLVDKGAVWVSPRFVALGQIKGIGGNAIVVETAAVVKEVNRYPELKALLDHRTIRGIRVYSETGDRLGTVSDMFIDDQTGEVLYYEVSGGAIGDMMKGKRTIVPGEVLSMGALVLYVSTATATRLEQQQGGVTAAFEQARQRVNQLSDQTADATNQRLARLGEQARQQQRTYVIGRTALRKVDDKEGRPLVQEGEIITADTVAQAEQQGRLPALLLAGGLGGAQQQLGALGQQANDSFAQIREEAQHLWNQLTHQRTRLTDQSDSRIEQGRIDAALGRPASRVILDRQDTVILNTGDIITNAAIAQARQAGVLHILLGSVYTERPQLRLDDLKAPWAGRASLEEAKPTAAPGAAAPPAALPAPPAATGQPTSS
ncbi:MAG TPA: PRC-barrel domain-containing protein [Chloroflexia bacterium]|nr:PRC-barrel domain-containing protein [Chloroflexia bacterium]